MFIPSGTRLSDLAHEPMRLVRKDGKQVLIIRSEGRVFAIANRCPHEGYPLSEGTLGAGCVLTCNWHNWKFALADGRALIGRDPVRTYPVELRGEEIFVDLDDPPAEAQRERALKGLDVAMADNDRARMAREVARLERAGFDARQAIVHAIVSRNERLETGMGHAHAAGADWLAMADRAPDEDRKLMAWLEPIGHLAWDTTGAGEFPYGGRTEHWDKTAFLSAMESEDEEEAIARMRGAIADRISHRELRPVLADAALAHYADFGHSAIYVLKAGQLIERLGSEVAAAMLLAEVRQLVQATREERLPEFRHYAKFLAEWSETGTDPLAAEAFEGLSVEGCLRRLAASAGRSHRELFDALLGAAAWNMLHFDLRFERATDNPIADNVGWLDFTHALTFANAARHLCEEEPSLWPKALLQLALFVGRNAAYVKSQDVGAWQVDDRAGFLAREQASLYDHGIVEPITACHRLKILFALEDELDAAPDAPWSSLMCAAVNRYLNTPMKRHHGLRLAAQARDFIAREG